jgi:hypothetical protein
LSRLFPTVLSNISLFFLMLSPLPSNSFTQVRTIR